MKGTRDAAAVAHPDAGEAGPRPARQDARAPEPTARRAASALRELEALHRVVLAGVTSQDEDGGLEAMISAASAELGLGSLALLLLDDDGRLVPRAVAGDPGLEVGEPVPVDLDVVYRACRIRASQRSVEHGRAGECAVPLRNGPEVIGTLFERLIPPAAVDDERVRSLERLAAEMAPIIQAARMRSRREQALRGIRELDEMKADFVAITSHELRTPLAAVRGFVNTLRRRLDRLSLGEVEEFLGIIDQQTDRLIRLVEDLLVVSRIEAGKLSFRPEPVRLRNLIGQIARDVGADDDRVEVTCSAACPTEIFIDPYRLGQVLTNLVHNALKFSSPPDPVALRVTRAAGGELEIAVSDRGIGIPKVELRRIFDRFHQSGAASTRTTEGAGLGLYITRRLVEAMDGSITVASNEGAGSTFRVWLPVDAAPQGPARPSGAAPAG